MILLNVKCKNFDLSGEYIVFMLYDIIVYKMYIGFFFTQYTVCALI